MQIIHNFSEKYLILFYFFFVLSRIQFVNATETFQSEYPIDELLNESKDKKDYFERLEYNMIQYRDDFDLPEEEKEQILQEYKEHFVSFCLRPLSRLL